MRPHQWTKNLAVVAGVLFARTVADPGDGAKASLAILDPIRFVPVLGLFAAFCLISSSIYLVNDILDREEDAQHPTKCRRPIAAGTLSVRRAWIAAFTLCAMAFSLDLIVEQPAGALPMAWILGAYLVVNASYNAGLKRIAITDVSCVALGFLIRVVGGPAVAGLEVSSWLVLCTFFGSLFLALAKRRGEMFATAEGGGGRSVLRQYDPTSLDLLVGMSGTATLLCYAIYTASPETVAKMETRGLLYTVPFVFLGLGRYFLILYRREGGEDPATTLFTDRGILLSIVGWLVASVIALSR